MRSLVAFLLGFPLWLVTPAEAADESAPDTKPRVDASTNRKTKVKARSLPSRAPVRKVADRKPEASGVKPAPIVEGPPDQSQPSKSSNPLDDVAMTPGMISSPLQEKPGGLSSLAEGSTEARRLRVRTEDGSIVVAKVHGASGDRVSLLLPDGRIGFSTGRAQTEEPFKPLSADELRESLLREPVFADFKVRQSPHYVVLYQSTDSFAEESIKLLENLYKNLSDVLRKRGFPVHEPEFPLVAIIFRTERDFRAYKRIDPDIQAYYEPISNRIAFYQTGEHDKDSPEVATLRKPQTVAHEGTHQILQNIGIQPRLSAWPLWLVEGLAEYCSPPTITRKGVAAWGGLGLVNPFHMATIHDLNDTLPMEVKGVARPQVGRDPKTPLVEYIVTRKELTPTDYALSWALTHYLLMKRSNEFLAFLKTMSQIPPLEERTPEDHLESFRAAFGTELSKMDKAIGAYLNKLKFDPLPYYAVMFEQPTQGGMIRRAAMVSQSPSVIRQWIESISSPQGGPTSWDLIPHPTKARAQLTAEQWMRNR